jgi:hypothetical protein
MKKNSFEHGRGGILSPDRRQQAMERYIRYDWEYQLAICVSCETGLPGGWVLRHIRKDHKETWKAHRKDLEEFVEGLTLLPPQELEHPTMLREKVDGITVKDGWVCGWHGCVAAGVSKHWVQRHCRERHGKAAVGEKCLYKGRIQTLLGHPYIKSDPR